MDAILNTLIQQVPDLGALIVVVLIFVSRMQKIEENHAATVKQLQDNHSAAIKALQDSNAEYLKRRDEIYVTTVQKVSDQMTRLIESFETHDQKTDDAVSEMRRTVARRQKSQKAKA